MQSWRKILDVLSTVFLILCAICAIFPFNPRMPAWDLDPSWMFAMNQAVAQHLRIGTDLIFTFGPYASVYTKLYHPATLQILTYGSTLVALGFIVSMGAILRGSTVRNLLLGIFLCAANYSVDGLFFFIVLGLGYFSLLANDRANERFDSKLQATYWFISLVVLGLFPLIKGSFLLLMLVTVGVTTLFLITKKFYKIAAVNALTPIVSMAVLWMLSGQDLGDLLPYFKSISYIIAGYTEAMASPGTKKEIVLYVLFSGTTIALIWSHFKTASYRLYLLALTAAALFVAFKAGFVRHDGHAVNSASLVAMTAILFFNSSRLKTGLAYLTFGIVVWAIICGHYESTAPSQLARNFSESYKLALQRIRLGYSNEAFAMPYTNSLNKIRRDFPLPKLEGTTDLYSYNQSAIIASDNVWNPRPIFQSYSAYTPELAELNAEHLLQKNAPDNIFYRVEPIDGRLPALEDGKSLPIILNLYSLVSKNPAYLILRRKSNEYPGLTEISSKEFHFDEPVLVPTDQATPIIAKITIQPSLLGKLKGLFYKPAELKFSAVLSDHQGVHHRILSNMASSEFILSPLIENNDEFEKLYKDAGSLSSKRVEAFTISAVIHPYLWKSLLKVEFFKMNKAP